MCNRLTSPLECLTNESDLWGNKAVNLSKTIKYGFPVPKGFVLSSSLFLEYRKKRKTDCLEAFLCNLDVFVEQSILANGLNKSELIFRSSANLEGNKSTSFCGIFDSIQINNNQRLSEPLVIVWESAFSNTAKIYCSKLGVDVNNISMAIIVQEFFHGTIYGVIQTKDVIGSSDNIVIEYSNKRSDAVVSGKDNTSMLVLARSGETITKDCCFELSDKQKNLLCSISQSIESKFLLPVEIEFSLYKDKITILQVRILT